MKEPIAIQKLLIHAVTVLDRHRPVDEAAVKILAASMEQIGLRTPITIRSPNESECYLVAGRHRLEAAKLLGWDKIDCFILDCSEDEAEMWEISENLHRAELTVIQRSEQVARWVQLAGAVLRQVDAKGRPESGKRKASRELNIPEPEVRRAVSIANLTPEAKAAAVEAGLDDNQSALLAAAKVEPEKQVEVITQRATRQASNHPQDDVERSIKWRRQFEQCWNKVPSAADREWALDWVDRPIMDSAA